MFPLGMFYSLTNERDSLPPRHVKIIYAVARDTEDETMRALTPRPPTVAFVFAQGFILFNLGNPK